MYLSTQISRRCRHRQTYLGYMVWVCGRVFVCLFVSPPPLSLSFPERGNEAEFLRLIYFSVPHDKHERVINNDGKRIDRNEWLHWNERRPDCVLR